MKNTILAILELDNYPEIVARRAAWLARLCDADLALFLCETKTGFLTDSIVMAAEARQIAEEVKADELKSLHQIGKDVAGEDLVVTTDYNYASSIFDSVVAEADRLEPLFVVKGTHYHKPSERAGFSDIDWRLIRKLRYPLWFAKPKAFADDAKIIAAVDPTHGNDKPATLDSEIIRYARKVSELTGSRLELIHTYQRIEELGAMATWAVKPTKLPIDELDERIQAEHRELLEKLAKTHGIDADAVHQLPGRPNEILPVFTRTHGAGLLVMGAISRASVKRRFVGNTAQRTLDHVDCDVLVIHPEMKGDEDQPAA